jgi:16S rRNA (cytosine967-C5)-methyltransferase
VRRHPDVRWLRRESDVAALSQMQFTLLQTLWPVVKPDGRLLYATCSIFSAEGNGVISRFMQTERQANKLDSHGLWLPTMSSLLHDGFYDALFEKRIEPA